MLALVYKSAWDVALEERPIPEIKKITMYSSEFGRQAYAVRT